MTVTGPHRPAHARCAVPRGGGGAPVSSNSGELLYGEASVAYRAILTWLSALAAPPSSVMAVTSTK